MTTPLLLAAPLLAGALITGVAAPAFADGSPSPTPSRTAASLSGLQAAGAADTSKRITSLTAAITRITAAKGLTDADRTTILDTLNADLTGMRSLASKIAADTTVAQARADVRSIFTQYRVYAVALPQARIAVEADRLSGTTIPRLQAAASKLASRVSASGNSGAQAELADLTTQLSTAQADVNGLSAAALAVTPSDDDADHSAMTALRDKAKAALAAVKQAAQDAKGIRQSLKK